VNTDLAFQRPIDVVPFREICRALLGRPEEGVRAYVGVIWSAFYETILGLFAGRFEMPSVLP